MNILLPNISCVLLSSSEASIKFWSTTLPFIYSCNQQEDSKKMTHYWNNGHQQRLKFSVFASLQFHWVRGSFQPRWAVLGHCGCSGFTRVFLTECEMFIMLLTFVIHTESAHQLDFEGEVLVQKKFPFVRKSPLILVLFFPFSLVP